MQARSEQTRHRLVLAGAEMFCRKGYANATLGQIVAAAGMTKGALYFHFVSKDRLADAVQEQGRAMLLDFVAGRRQAGEPPVQVLIDLTHWLVRARCADPVVRAGFRIAHECAGRVPPVTDFHQVWTAEVLRLVDEARAAGDLRAHAGPETTEVLLPAAVCGIAALADTGPTYDELRGRTRALWTALLPVLVPRGALDRYRLAPADPPAETATTTPAPAPARTEEPSLPAGLVVSAMPALSEEPGLPAASAGPEKTSLPAGPAAFAGPALPEEPAASAELAELAASATPTPFAPARVLAGAAGG
ncbi:ScbR family autoregulator-binding transcription factor [Streptomyces sp. NPDC004111]|uniref:ScbR family autoregulator-binding transcription factor n=1 Tax=Streptomyces sp. NPDC004111 TaxID=3364690 RepID=UPI003680793B